MGIKTDICIIGGGPAGCVLGARLAQFGLGVCLVERAVFPRRHLGESLSPGVLPLLASIGAGPAIEAAGYLRARKVSVHWEEEREREDPEGAEIVMLKFFTGLSNKEAARTLGVSESTVERRWAFAKVCLFQLIREADAAPGGDC